MEQLGKAIQLVNNGELGELKGFWGRQSTQDRFALDKLKISFDLFLYRNMSIVHLCKSLAFRIRHDLMLECYGI